MISKNISLFFVFLLFVNLSFVSAEIIIQPVESVYNLEDSINIESIIKPQEEVSGFFQVDIYCGGEKSNLYRTYHSLEKESETNITTSVRVNSETIGDLRGDCYLVSSISRDNATSSLFRISDNIEVVPSVFEVKSDPSDIFVLKGEAFKDNGMSVEGFLEWDIPGVDVSQKGIVNGGNYEIEISFPDDVAAGRYGSILSVYEKDESSEITNRGNVSIAVNINQIPKGVEVAIDKQTLLPGENISFNTRVYDQSKENFEGDVSIKIFDESDKVLFQKIVKSGSSEVIDFPLNSTPGYWSLEAKAFGIETKRLFYVEEIEKASFNIVGGDLTVRNIGNTVYSRSVQIVLGDELEIIDVELDVGEERVYRVSAPTGDYEMKVDDGEETATFSSVSLTGNAISIDELRSSNLFKGNNLTILLIIFIVGLALFGTMFRMSKKSKNRAKSSSSHSLIKKGVTSNTKMASGGDVDVSSLKAVHSLVLHGQKQEVGLVSVRISNLMALKKNYKDSINKLKEEINIHRGAVYETEDHLVGVFSALTTRTFKNPALAAKVSENLSHRLKDYNHRFKDKFDWGIAVTVGDLVLELDKEKKELKFTNIGNTLPSLKKLSILAKEKVLMNNTAQHRIASEVVVKRVGSEDYYELESVKNREKHDKFVNDFLKRQKK